MTRPTRVTLRIDRIVADRQGLDRAALVKAIEMEVQQIIAQGGIDALGASRNLAFGRGAVPGGKTPLAARVAQATLAAVRQ